MSRPGRALLAAVAVGVLAVSTGCGVPRSSDPKVVGDAPGFGPPVAQDREAKLPDPNGATAPGVLVERYLQAAAAGDWDPEVVGNQRIAKAVEHAGKFLSPDFKREWQPTGKIRVVDVVSTVPGPDYVEVVLRTVGVLSEDGSIDLADPDVPISEQPRSVRFPVQRIGDLERGGAELRLTQVPNELLLSTGGLRELFDVRPVYFWDALDRYLVPDRRYLAKGVSRDKRVREVVDRLVQGPSRFLSALGEIGLPADTFSGHPVVDQSKIIVNLSASSPSESRFLNRLASQLRWSLHPEKLPLELRIGGKSQNTYAGTDYLADNPAQKGARPNQDDRLYGVHDGKVVAVAPGSSGPPILDTAENSNVVSAALSRGRNAALVRRHGANLGLWLGQHDNETTAPAFSKVDLPPTTAMSRPSYVPDSRNRVLVAAANRLFDVSEDGTFGQVDLSPEHGPVTAVAVAADGWRVAILAGDRVLVATLDARVTPARLGKRHLLYTPGLTNLRGVAWAYEHQLVVAGAAELVEISVDNGHRAKINIDLGPLEITQVASVPIPWAEVDSDSARGPLVIEAGQQSNYQAYYVYPTSAGLAPVPAPRGASPSASAPPGQGPAGSASGLRAPFFLDVE